MKKKIIPALAMLVFVGLAFAACTGNTPSGPQSQLSPEATPVETGTSDVDYDISAPEHPEEDKTTEIPQNASAQDYTRLTAQEYHYEGGLINYAFFLTNVEERGDHLLLRGVFASEWLPYEKLEKARAGTPIEINGETFTHSFVYFPGNQWPTDVLHNVRTEDELNLSPNGMMALVDTEGDWHSAWYSIGIYREIEIGQHTPIEGISAIDAFSDLTQPYMVDGLFLGDSLWFHFDEHGEVVRVSFFWDFCTA